jgi:hypothetical protein
MPPAQPPAKAPLIELDKTIVANITSDIGIFEKCIAIPGIKEIVEIIVIKVGLKYTFDIFKESIKTIKELMENPPVFINKFVLINQQFIDFYKLINDLLFQLKFNETIKSNSIDITDLKNKNFKEINEQYNKINKTTQPYQNFLKNNFFNHKTLMKQLYSKLPGLPLKDYEKWEINRSIITPITPITSGNDELYSKVSNESNVFIHKETKYESKKIIDDVQITIINQWKTENMVNFKKTYKTIIENILLPIIDKIKQAKAALIKETSFKFENVEIDIKKLDEDLELCNILEHMLDRIYECSKIQSGEAEFIKIRETHKPKLKLIIDNIRTELLDIKYGLYLILMALEAS